MSRKPVLLFLTLTLIACSVSCQDKLPAVDLVIGGQTWRVEVARDPLAQQKGLMFRTALGEREGMIFVYERDDRLSFWMENTLIPLSIAFISAGGEILQIEDMNAMDKTTVESRFSVRYALEVNRGAFARQGIKVGDKVIFPPDWPS